MEEEKKKMKVKTSKKKNNDKNKEYAEKIKKLEDELKAEKEKCMRIQAEMFNFRKRKDEEVANNYKYANENILKELVNIMDNFERALAFEKKENEEFLKGFKMIYMNILNILKDNEVTEIDCLNKPFNPAFHQAVLTEKKKGVESGIVLQVLQKGYMYKDKVLRATMVKVSE